MQRLQLMIGKLMLAGALTAAGLTIIGAIFYLINHGNDMIHYQVFQTNHAHIRSYYSGRGILELGLFVLVFTQVLRVALTTWLFIKARDKWFIGFSLFVLGMLIYSLFA